MKSKLKGTFLIIIFQLLFFLASGQNNFLNKLYFPNSIGPYIFLNNKSLKNDFVFSTEIEYRLKKSFLRMSYDVAILNYELSDYKTTNVIKGEMMSYGYFLGYGLRKQNIKLKYYCLLQMGFNKFEYPYINDFNNSTYESSFKDLSFLSFKLSGGIEYYFFENFALTADLFYTGSPYTNNFTNNRFQAIGFKLGVTATLFSQ